MWAALQRPGSSPTEAASPGPAVGGWLQGVGGGGLTDAASPEEWAPAGELPAGAAPQRELLALRQPLQRRPSPENREQSELVPPHWYLSVRAACL